MVSVLSVDTPESAAKWIFVAMAVTSFAAYALWNIRRDEASTLDNARVINGGFFEDVKNENRQIQDDTLWLSGYLPDRLVYVIRDSKLVQVLTSVSSLLERRTFIELVARLEAFKKHYYAALEKHFDSIQSSDILIPLYDVAADLRAMKNSILRFMHSLVHQIPPEKQAKLFEIIDEISASMQDAIKRLKKVYAMMIYEDKSGKTAATAATAVE